jgi:ribonucleotide monophosphatase NagD (HAD superfamily)
MPCAPPRASSRPTATDIGPRRKGGEPDAASVIAAIEASTSRGCEQIVGKPSALTSRYLLDRLTLRPDQCVLVGDRLEADVAMALQAGVSAALVLTGATSRADAALSPIKGSYGKRYSRFLNSISRAGSG